jgi:hypothetical protein
MKISRITKIAILVGSQDLAEKEVKFESEQIMRRQSGF